MQVDAATISIIGSLIVATCIIVWRIAAMRAALVLQSTQNKSELKSDIHRLALELTEIKVKTSDVKIDHDDVRRLSDKAEAFHTRYDELKTDIKSNRSNIEELIKERACGE